MKRLNNLGRRRRAGTALLMVMVVVVISAFVLGGALRWTSSNLRLNERNNEYFRAVAAAEAATEKVVSQISRDFRERGWAYVDGRLGHYSQLVPTVSESPQWQDWNFFDPASSTNSVFVSRYDTAQFVELKSQYTGLRGAAATYSVIANANQNSSQYGDITAGVRQQFQLATIPVFQFAIFYGVLMEIFPGPEFHVIGRVHSNDDIYFGSSSGLNFHTHVTSVGNMYNQWAPGDSSHIGDAGSSVSFGAEVDERTAHLQLPIGTNNSPDAVREILAPAPLSESPKSPMGRQRYYNKSDLVVNVNDSGVTVTSGLWNNFGTSLATNDWQTFVSTTNSFRDWREEKLVQPVDIDVAGLRNWASTNSVVRSALGNEDVASIYVNDERTLASDELGAVRVYNGETLPDNGLTISTENPLYVQGHFNQPFSSYLGTTNTAGTKPASFAADAITILSESWSDDNSYSSSLGDRLADHTTVNAAFLAGIVPTLDSNRAGKYSGGVENYPRLLENWVDKTLTYNGSMVVLFNSQYATNGWEYGGSIYEAPNRNWSFDLNFLDPTKLPPGTPALSALVRGSWSVVRAGSTNMTTESEVVTIDTGLKELGY